MIGIISAVDEEKDAILSMMDSKNFVSYNGNNITLGKLFQHDVVFLQSGVGKVNASWAATVLIEKYKVDKIIFSGVAGSLNKKINIGDIVVATDLVQSDVDATAFGYKLGQIPQMKEYSFKTDENILSMFINGKINVKMNLNIGRIITSDKFISSIDEKINLGNTFNALCTDMESGAVGQVCYMYNVPCTIIRTISDSITDESTMEYKEFVQLAAKNSSIIVKEILNNI